MLSVSLGPLGLSLGHLILMLAFIVALVVGAVSGRKEGTPVAGSLADIFLVAMVCARIGFVIRYFEHYQNHWLGVLDIRDGGFDVLSGLTAALVFAGYLWWRRRPVRRPLAFAMAAGLITWGSVSGLIGLIESQAQSLPDTPLATLDGQPTSLAGVAAGQPVVVNLWASWCPPCIREMPVLEEAQQRYPEVAFVFANQGEHPDTIRHFLASHSLTLDHVLSDRSGALGRVSGSQGLPTTLFYNARGQLVDSHMGELSHATLARSLERFDSR